MKPFAIILALLLSLNLHAAPHWLDKPAPVATVGDELVLKRMAAGLEDGWGLAFLPDQRLLVSSRKPGSVWLLDAAGSSIVEVLSVSDHYRRGQGGLFALWVDKNFTDYPYVYLAKAVGDSGKTTTRLMRYRWQDKQLLDETVLFTAEPFVRNSGHFGGAIAQDNRGHLYLSIGDRRQRPRVQELDNHVGTIVRLKRDGAVPDDNPLPARGRPEIFSYGHRNPQGLFWHQGNLWQAEHGPQGGDEFNRIKAGANYGWPEITYGEEYGGGRIGDTEKTGMEQPLYYYVPSIATSDLLLYQGAYLKSLQGSALIASLKAGIVSQLVRDGDGWKETRRLFAELGERWRSIKQDAEGRVWLLAESGNLYQLDRQ